MFDIIFSLYYLPHSSALSSLSLSLSLSFCLAFCLNTGLDSEDKHGSLGLRPPPEEEAATETFACLRILPMSLILSVWLWFVTHTPCVHLARR